MQKNNFMGKHKLCLTTYTCETYERLFKEKQLREAKEYQDSLHPPGNEHMNKYYNDLTNGYTPNITKYLK